MSDIVDSGAAPAVSEGTAAPATPEQVVQTPNPVKTEPVTKPEEPAEKPKVSTRDAIKQAREKVEAKEREEQGDKAKPIDSKAKAAEPAKPDPKDATKPDPKAAEKTGDETTDKAAAKPEEGKGAQRDETGRFAAKDAQGAQEGQQGNQARFDPPKRFSPDAVKEWETTPTSVKAEIHRALRENEEGITKYKQSHERYEQLKEFDELAKTNGRDLRESLVEVKKFEDMMKASPLDALNHALAIAGPRKKDGTPLTMNDVVNHLAGQSSDERVQQFQRREQQLLGEIQKLTNHIKQSEAVSKIPDVVKQFASDPAHSRFEELSETIAVLIEAGTAPDLKTAYKLADTLKPATNGAHTPADTNGAHTAKNTDDDAEAQTLKAQEAAAAKAATTVKGAPGSGSTPAKKPQSSTVRDSLKRALAQAG